MKDRARKKTERKLREGRAKMWIKTGHNRNKEPGRKKTREPGGTAKHSKGGVETERIWD